MPMPLLLCGLPAYMPNFFVPSDLQPSVGSPYPARPLLAMAVDGGNA